MTKPKTPKRDTANAVHAAYIAELHAKIDRLRAVIRAAAPLDSLRPGDL